MVGPDGVELAPPKRRDVAGVLNGVISGYAEYRLATADVVVAHSTVAADKVLLQRIGNRPRGFAAEVGTAIQQVNAIAELTRHAVIGLSLRPGDAQRR
jgi:hypothetical protein